MDRAASEDGSSESQEEQGGGFGDGDGGLRDIGVGVGLAEVVEDVGGVGKVDGGLIVEVAGGPIGVCLAEVIENGGEVGEVDGSVGVGVAEEFRGDEDAVGINGLAAEGGERGGEGGVVDDGETEVSGQRGTCDAGGVDMAISNLVLGGGKNGGFGGGGGFEDEFVVGEIEAAGPGVGGSGEGKGVDGAGAGD